MAKKTPSYCHHKASGKAVLRINGKDVDPDGDSICQSFVDSMRIRRTDIGSFRKVIQRYVPSLALQNQDERT